MGLEGDLAPNSLVYGDVSTGYKAGGFFAAYQNNTFKPEEITAYEIGIKNKLFDGRLELNADAFDYDYTDYQVQTVVVGQFAPPPAPPVPGLLTLNARAARFYGGELDGRYLLTPNDRIDASVSVLHAIFKEFEVPGPSSPPFFGGSYAGTTPPFAPPLTAQGTYAHNWNLANGAVIDAEVQDAGHLGARIFRRVDHVVA